MPADHLGQMTRALATPGICGRSCIPDPAYGERYVTSVVSFPTTHSLFNNEKTSDKHKLRDFLQNNWSVLFKSVKVMETRKDKEIVMDWRRLKRHDS